MWLAFASKEAKEGLRKEERKVVGREIKRAFDSYFRRGSEGNNNE